MMAIEQHYSARTLAELLDCSTETIRRAAASGDLMSVRVGADRRFAESAVVDWLGRRAGRRLDFGSVASIDRRRASGA